MSDSEGSLPQRTTTATDDRGSLPPLPEAPAVPAQPLRPVHDEAARPVVSPAAVVAASSFDERLAAATTAGGVTALPPGFGDPEGDWVTVRSDNPFTVLYLDGRQAHRVTPEMALRHHDLLQRFWQEKLRSMSQGAARLAILKKYGGPDESERLVRSYPDLIESAYVQLATRGGIDAASQRLRAERDAVIHQRIDGKLDDYLVDSVLQPDELRALLVFAEQEGASRDAVIDRVRERLRIRGFVPEREPAGATLEAQLLSTPWLHPSVRRSVVVDVATPRRRSPLVPLLLFSLVVVIGLLVGGAIRMSRVKAPDLPTTATINSPTATTSVVTQTIPVTRTVFVPAPAPPEVPRTETRPSSADEEKRIEEKRVEEKRAEERLAEERRRIREAMAEIRGVANADPKTALERIAALEQNAGSSAGEERVALAALRSDVEKALLTQQLQKQQAQMEADAAARAAADRDRQWAQRIAAIEELMNQPNYSGAKTLADRVVADPEAPPAIAERAKQLRDRAVAELQKIFSGATVKSKTGRPPHPQK